MEYRLQGDFYRALELFRTASLRNPAYFDPLFASAEVFFQLEEYDEALKMVEAALRLAKTNPPARILKARILVGMGRFQEAADVYTTLLSEEPNNVDARLGKAELDIALGKNRNAAIEYLDTLKRFPDNRRALLSLGVLFMQQGNYQQAETYFETALRYHSDSPIVHLLVGEYYFKLKKYDLAIEQAHTALSIKPDFEEAHNLLGIISFQRGEYLETYTRMDQILALNRNNSLAWYLKALSALRLSRQEEGITLLRTLVNLAPEDEISRITLEDSLREYLPVEHALRKTYALYHFERGDKFQERNLFNRAFEEYRRGLQIDPYSVRGRLSYADILQKLGFPASSYNSLYFLKKQNSTDRTVLEQLEIAESLQADRTARRWNIDQFMQRNPSFRLSLFVDVRASSLVHPFSELFLLQYNRDLLLGNPSVTVASPLSVDSFSEAFQEARQRGTDYFLIVRFNETDREFSVSGDIYLSRTGGKIDSFSVFRTGNDRIQNALVQVASLMKEKIPLRGELLRREFEKGLVGLGSIDGVKKGDKFYILPARSLSLKNDSFGFVFPPGDILGTFTVTDLDDLVCEGVVEKNGFFDRINPGDVLIPYIDLQAKSETGTSSTVPSPEPSLYRKILKIQ
jgi:tetratricopeptide (TPR) repeat protein